MFNSPTICLFLMLSLLIVIFFPPSYCLLPIIALFFKNCFGVFVFCNCMAISQQQQFPFCCYGRGEIKKLKAWHNIFRNCKLWCYPREKKPRENIQKNYICLEFLYVIFPINYIVPGQEPLLTYSCLLFFISITSICYLFFFSAALFIMKDLLLLACLVGWF